LPEAEQEHEAAHEQYAETGKAQGDPEPSPRMVEGEDENFLRFATALKMIVGRSIHLDQLPRIKSLLEEYLLTFSEIYGSGQMKPNHHWAVHVPDELMDFGPVYNFWAFLTERLNKLLKNLNSNNWTGGALEVSMMREFHRNAALDSRLHRILANAPTLSPTQALESNFVQMLVGVNANVEAVGTVQDAAHSELSSSRVKFGTVAKKMERIDSSIMKLALLKYYNRDHPQVILNAWEDNPPPNTTPLILYADSYNYALLDGR